LTGIPLQLIAPRNTQQWEYYTWGLFQIHRNYMLILKIRPFFVWLLCFLGLLVGNFENVRSYLWIHLISITFPWWIICKDCLDVACLFTTVPFVGLFAIGLSVWIQGVWGWAKDFIPLRSNDYDWIDIDPVEREKEGQLPPVNGVHPRGRRSSNRGLCRWFSKCKLGRKDPWVWVRRVNLCLLCGLDRRDWGRENYVGAVFSRRFLTSFRSTCNTVFLYLTIAQRQPV